MNKIHIIRFLKEVLFMNEEEKKPLFVNRKWYYFLTELLVGMALMGVEMSASRFISVYFSSSQVIWTIIIGVIMIAMAIGNYWGGRQADKKPSYTRLYIELLAAGTWIVLIPFVGRFIIAGISAFFALFISEGLVIWAALFSCIILFAPPLLMLGKVTPSLVKYSMGEKVSGKVIGTLEALNTVGSIVGTFLPTFLTIPFVGTSNSFVLFGGVIALLGLVYIITHLVDDFRGQYRAKKEGIEIPKKNSKKTTKTTILSAICASFWIFGMFVSTNASFIFWNDNTLIWQGESMYNYLRVYKDGKTNYFSTNALFGVQSCINDDNSLTDMYYDYLLVSPYIVDNPNPKVLVLGNGTGTYATMMKEYLGVNADITGVEIDQKIIDISYTFFHMNKDVNVICDDGRHFISRDSNLYDIILVDAYSSISAPFHMTTVEFFRIVKNHLTDNGLMIMNINMRSNRRNSIDVALRDTAYSVFSNLYYCDVPNGSGVEIYSYKNPDLDVKEKVIAASLDTTLFPFRDSFISHLYKYVDTGLRLYDDTADVEIKSLVTLDDMVLSYLSYYRDVFRTRGLKGLIEVLMG